MKWLNPINWLTAPAVALVKSYAIGFVKDAVRAKKDKIVYWCARVGGWIAKCEAVLAFLKSLKEKLEDGVLEDGEAKDAIAEAKQLAAEVTK